MSPPTSDEENWAAPFDTKDILTRLLDPHAAEHGLEAPDWDTNAYVENRPRAMGADERLHTEDDLTAEEAAQVRTLRRDTAGSIIRPWKVNRALHRQYGGS